MKKYKVTITLSWRYEVANESEAEAIKEALEIWSVDRNREDSPVITVSKK